MKNADNAELGSIEREIYIDAAPELVFEVISDPVHVARWWPDTASYEVMAGATGEITFGDPSADGKTEVLTLVEVEPPTTFSFRWTHAAGQEPAAGNSLLVTFELVPSGTGTILKFVETGFRELGWDIARLEAKYADHVRGWNFLLPRLAQYLETLRSHA